MNSSAMRAVAPAGTNAEALAKLLKIQQGVVTRKQALERGVTWDVLRGRIKKGGTWQRLLPGVYASTTGTPTADQLDMAALLYAGPGSALTGSAALRWYSARSRPGRAGLVDVLVPAARQRQSLGFVAVHFTTRWPEMVCHRGPFDYVLPARAVADSVRLVEDLATARAVVAGAVQSGLCTVQLLCAELRAGPVRGSALLRRALAEVTEGARSGSEAEFMDLLKRGRLSLPMFNARLYLDDELIAVADAWWPEAALVAEVDSREWHLSPADWEGTMRRHDRLTSLGILVLHFSPNQIKNEPEQVLEVIRTTLGNRRGGQVLGVTAKPAVG
ncbi:MAG TPA: hypothetical protein VMA95_12905 [Streptosporangiaceae bacterium]|nr:hypothetical protein [Streptosporangiaceae bacterium]